MSSNRFLRALQEVRSRPLVIAHRGDSAHAPENTLEAARLAHARGADAWELDVHLSRDGVPIVLHDESLARTTDVRREFASDARVTDGAWVADFDLAEIGRLDAGSWFVSETGGSRTASAFGTLDRLPRADRERFRSGSVRVPTLREALELTRELDWIVSVELKSFPNHDDRLLDAVFRDLEETGTADRVLLSSFDHGDVHAAGVRNSQAITGVLAWTPLVRSGEYVRDVVGATTFHPSAELLGADSRSYRASPHPERLRVEILDELHALNVPVLVYTVNDTSDHGLARQLADLGVSGLFTDDPGGMVTRFG